jgi:multiple sugar transport system permease protein
VRALIAGIYLALTAGAVTMVYPFLVTLSGSLKTSVDRADFDLLPAWFRDDAALYRKHVECKFNNSVNAFSMATRTRTYGFHAVRPPAPTPAARVSDWRRFEDSAAIAPGQYALGYTVHAGDRMELWKHREFRHEQMRRFDRNLDAFNRVTGAHAPSWLTVAPPPERPSDRRYRVPAEPLLDAYYAFKAAQPAWLRVYASPDGHFVQQFLEPLYGPIAAYNAKHGAAHGSYREVVLAERPPSDGLARSDWERFVRDELHVQFIAVSDEARPAFAAFLRDRYAGDLAALNRRYGVALAAFEDVRWPADRLHPGDALADWTAFVKVCPLDCLRVDSPETRYRRFLRDRYAGDLAALNRAHGTAYASFDTVPMPVLETDHACFLEHRPALRREFLTANYRQVLDYVTLHGRALLNTAIYCLLAVLAALTINPMAAYALSRWRLRATYRLLLFFLATMAFPAAVTMIPGFLLLKGMGLLNTFAALVLPGAANGFSIFLLKGFFDSLPRELYESAEIDGAGEWTLFWRVTMALSKPILAVVALGAFTAAYGNFMFAFLLCPDERMWTLMVFLYQLQINGHTALTFAALLVAAVPTLVAFLACQRLIMRGIVVPVEK